jgi:hypothetical protein
MKARRQTDALLLTVFHRHSIYRIEQLIPILC